jgi:rhodanese-related sulfurtransferase
MSILDKIKQTIQNAQNASKKEAKGNAPIASRAPVTTSQQAKQAPKVEESTMNQPQSIPQIAPLEVAQKLESGENVTFLDIRMPWDHDAMHPKGAKPFPINEIQSRLDELDKDKSYVLSCYHGYSSQDATAFLLENGFTDVKSMIGGFSGWSAAGLPVEGKYQEG